MAEEDVLSDGGGEGGEGALVLGEHLLGSRQGLLQAARQPFSIFAMYLVSRCELVCHSDVPNQRETGSGGGCGGMSW
jgi:hypothetical protein